MVALRHYPKNFLWLSECSCFVYWNIWYPEFTLTFEFQNNFGIKKWTFDSHFPQLTEKLGYANKSLWRVKIKTTKPVREYGIKVTFSTSKSAVWIFISSSNIIQILTFRTKIWCWFHASFQLSTGENANYYKLLNIFAYGTYADYKGTTSTYFEL